MTYDPGPLRPAAGRAPQRAAHLAADGRAGGVLPDVLTPRLTCRFSPMRLGAAPASARLTGFQTACQEVWILLYSGRQKRTPE